MVKDNTTGIIVLLIIASAFLFAYNNSGLMSLAELTTSISFPPDNLVHSVSFENYRADIKVYTGTKWTGQCLSAIGGADYPTASQPCGQVTCGVDSNGCMQYAANLKGVCQASNWYYGSACNGCASPTCTYNNGNKGGCYICTQWDAYACSSSTSACGSGGGGSKTEQICNFDYSILKNEQVISGAVAQSSSFVQKLDNNVVFIFGESSFQDSTVTIESRGTKEVCSYSDVYNSATKTYESVKSCSTGTNYITKLNPQLCENMMGRFKFIVNDDDFKFTFNVSNKMLFASIQNNLRQITTTPCFDYNFTINGFMYGQEKCFAEETFNVGKNDMMFALPSDIPHDFKVTPKFKNMKIMVNGASTSISDYVGLEYSILEAQPVQVNNTSIQNTSSTQNSTLQSVTTTTRSWWQSFIDWLYAMWIWILSVFK